MNGIYTNCTLRVSDPNNFVIEPSSSPEPVTFWDPDEELSFSILAGRWLDGKSVEVRPSTLKKYRTTLRKYLLPIFGDRLLSQITSQELESFQKNLIQKQNLSSATAGQILLVFKMIYRFGYPSRNLEAPSLSIHPLRRQPPEMRVLSRCEQ